MNAGIGMAAKAIMVMVSFGCVEERIVPTELLGFWQAVQLQLECLFALNVIIVLVKTKNIFSWGPTKTTWEMRPEKEGWQVVTETEQKPTQKADLVEVSIIQKRTQKKLFVEKAAE